MAFWEAAGRETAVTERDTLIRRYTETVMQMLETAHEGGRHSLNGSDLEEEEGKASFSGGTSHLVHGKYKGEGDAYWDAQYADSSAMQQHGFCKTASQKYGPSDWQIRAKPAEDLLACAAAPLTEDAPCSTPPVEDTVSAPERRVTRKNTSYVFDANVGSRYLDEKHLAEKGELVPVLDGRAAVQKTVVDDIAAKRTLRKLNTLTALLQKQKTGVQNQDTMRLPRVAMVTLNARRRMYYTEDEPPFLCRNREDSIFC